MNAQAGVNSIGWWLSGRGGCGGLLILCVGVGGFFHFSFFLVGGRVGVVCVWAARETEANFGVVPRETHTPTFLG